jgi:alpha-galactosidase
METLKLLWELGPSPAGAVREAMQRDGREWAYTTTKTVLDRLEEKGYARRNRQETPHVYVPVSPPELMGSHVGATTAHTTMRTHRVGFRAVAGLFGSFGAEWNLLDATTDERSQLAEAIALHKRFGELLHSGDVLRVDHPDSTVSVHGMISSDRRESLLAVTRLRSGTTHHTAPLRVPDLDPDRSYELRLLETFGEPLGHARSHPTWTRSGITATGRHLGAAGVSLPVLYPESSRLIHLVAVD